MLDEISHTPPEPINNDLNKCEGSFEINPPLIPPLGSGVCEVRQ